MVQPSWLIALQELKAIPTPETTLQCLRRIKNDIIGHEQRKELVVKYGVLEPLTEILESCVKASGKKSTQQINGSGFGTKNYDVHWGIEDEIRLQATLIVGSLANGVFFRQRFERKHACHQDSLLTLVPCRWPSFC